ncbi:MAG: restriction endonuclease subunit S [Bacteroidales bacterium]
MIVNLSEIVTIKSGIYQNEQPDGNAIYLQVNDFSNLELSYNQLKATVFIEGKSSDHLLRKDDLLFAAKGTSNFCVKYPSNIGNAVASSAFFVIRVINQEVLPDFLAWFLNLPRTLAYLQSQSVGSVIPSITKKMLENLSLNVPDIATQQKIVEFSSLQQKEIKLYKQIAQKRQIFL